MSRAYLMAAGAVLATALGCGGSHKGAEVAVSPDFDCYQRHMAYEVTGGFGAYKMGVAARCDQGAPELISFRQESADSERVVKRFPLSSREFDKLWEAIDSTGWRQLTDCEYLGLEGDPQYVIMIGNRDTDTKINCSPEDKGLTKKLQFPEDSIVNELDRAVARAQR